MVEYIFVFILTFIGVLYNRRMEKSIRIFYITILCIYVVLLMGLRYRVGIDTLNYMDSYSEIPSIGKFISTFSFNESRDPLFYIVGSLCREFTKEFWLMQIVMASITNICIFVFIYKTCSNPFLGIFIYLYIQGLYFNTEIVRESAAVSIFLLNYLNLEKKRFTRFYLVSFISIGFHISAAIIWFTPLFRKLRINIYYLIACVAIISVTPLLENINEMLAIASFENRVNSYIADAEILNLNWRIAELFKNITLPILVVCLYSKKKEFFRFKGMVLLQIILCMGTFAVPVIFSRFTNYSSMFVVVSLANAISYKKTSYFIKTILVSILIASQSFNYYQMYQRWIPYVSIFNPVKISDREKIRF